MIWPTGWFQLKVTGLDVGKNTKANEKNVFKFLSLNGTNLRVKRTRHFRRITSLKTDKRFMLFGKFPNSWIYRNNPAIFPHCVSDAD
nr:CIC_HP1_G0027420.mRNA.1.CDS.1 [Saccharomyces cerevisiae]